MPITCTPFTQVYGPLSIPGVTCALWLDAADTTTLTFSGPNVTQWRDKSASRNNSTSCSATTSSINGNTVLTNPIISGPITNSGSSVVNFFIVGTLAAGKYDQWDSEDFAIAQKPTCDVCMGTLVHRFPWGLLHSVAEQANSMEFLKNFNAQYPCETCRGGFFDEPQTGEKTLDWTYRNHQRLDPSFVIPVPPPVDPLVPYGYSKDPFTNEILPIVAKLPGYSA